MKKTLVSLSLCALVAFGATSCKKDIEQNNGDYQFRATMENCSGDSKTTYNGTAIQWNANDTVMIYGLVPGRYIATPEEDNPGSAKLRRLGAPVTYMGDEVTAIYPAALANSATSVSLPAEQVSVDGNLISNFPMYATTTDENLAFKNLFGALKLHLQQEGATVSRIEVTADVEINGNFDIDNSGENPEVTYADGGSYTTTLICTTPQDITNGHDFFVTMPAGTYSNLTIKIQNAGYGVEKHSPQGATITIERSRYFTLGFQALNMPVPPEDGVWGLFSVSATQQVWIAAGNLQFNKTIGTYTSIDQETHDGTWRIAEHQYDRCGWNRTFGPYAANSFQGNVEGGDNASSNGWIDLVCWAATGYNGLNPLPRPSFSTRSGYSNDTDPLYNVESIAGTNYDWGVYIIGDQWRTWTYDEFRFLTQQTGNAPMRANRQGGATVCGVPGLLLLPDLWNGPAINTANAYTSNVYDAEAWAEMESYGAAFLPCTGAASSTLNIRAGSGANYGAYWTVTAAGYNTSSDLWKNAFHGVVDGANTGNIAGTNNEEYRGMAAVRLVKNYVPAN